jgi:hypothetical protein
MLTRIQRTFQIGFLKKIPFLGFVPLVKSCGAVVCLSVFLIGCERGAGYCPGKSFHSKIPDINTVPCVLVEDVQAQVEEDQREYAHYLARETKNKTQDVFTSIK